MFGGKESNAYSSEIWFDEFQWCTQALFLKAAAYTCANGARFTLDNMVDACRKFTVKTEQVRTDCTTCAGWGAIVKNGFAYSCNCKAGDNYSNYPKYNGETTEYLKVVEHEDCTVRTFGRYTVTVAKGARSAKDVSFRID